MTDIGEVVTSLPGLHDRVWAVSDPVQNKEDQEALEHFLEQEDRRQQFYDALNQFAGALNVALGMVAFYNVTPEAQVNRYKWDIKFFHRTSFALS